MRLMPERSPLLPWCILAGWDGLRRTEAPRVATDFHYTPIYKSMWASLVTGMGQCCVYVSHTLQHGRIVPGLHLWMPVVEAAAACGVVRGWFVKAGLLVRLHGDVCKAIRV